MVTTFYIHVNMVGCVQKLFYAIFLTNQRGAVSDINHNMNCTSYMTICYAL